MKNRLRTPHFFLFLFLIAATVCQAQSGATAKADSRFERQVKLTIRSQYNVPPDYTVTLGQRGKSDISGYDSLPVIFTNSHGDKKTTAFLISKDNNTLARLEKFDLTRNPASTISTLGRPVRGNPKAKVTIISFDDLECPFCAQMNQLLFPETEKHYGSQVRFFYKDFPLPIHPWAMHAAVDVNCMAAQSPAGYWNMVDYIHSHDSEISGEGGTQNIAASNAKLDQATQEEGKRQKVDMNKLNACIAKQDTSGIRDSIREGDSVGVDGTPTLFINGERATGALPKDMLWSIIDRAILDAGEVPPPRTDSASAATSAQPVK
jgi:protein-disulfide isomerase